MTCKMPVQAIRLRDGSAHRPHGSTDDALVVCGTHAGFDAGFVAHEFPQGEAHDAGVEEEVLFGVEGGDLEDCDAAADGRAVGGGEWDGGQPGHGGGGDAEGAEGGCEGGGEGAVGDGVEEEVVEGGVVVVVEEEVESLVV